MNKDEIVAKLRDATEDFTGSRMPDFSPSHPISSNVVYVVIDLIEEQAKVISALTKALKGVLAEHTYVAPAGNTNCRFCDNDMDHEGTFMDMHEPDCIIHSVRSAVTLSKALPSES